MISREIPPTFNDVPAVLSKKTPFQSRLSRTTRRTVMRSLALPNPKTSRILSRGLPDGFLENPRGRIHADSLPWPYETSITLRSVPSYAQQQRRKWTMEADKSASD
ncbi:hypothetical protein E4U21_007676 [Claviceps maximensis]|nr:hypothetical protein E4U21_007676 [Claviceps maximensis]